MFRKKNKNPEPTSLSHSQIDKHTFSVQKITKMELSVHMVPEFMSTTYKRIHWTNYNFMTYDKRL